MITTISLSLYSVHRKFRTTKFTHRTGSYFLLRESTYQPIFFSLPALLFLSSELKFLHRIGYCEMLSLRQANRFLVINNQFAYENGNFVH